MAVESYDPIAAAALLRELAAELQNAEGPARNGLFLELHRLHDTLFRLTLESHSDLPRTLRGQAFNLADPLPAPQVIRELNSLGSPLAAQNIRSLYKHMNFARNTMAHDPVVARVTVSRANSKRMIQLANLVADELDPTGEGHPVTVSIAAPREWLSKRLYLGVGLLLGLATWLGVSQWASDVFVSLAIFAVTLTVAVVLWYVAEK